MRLVLCAGVPAGATPPPTAVLSPPSRVQSKPPVAARPNHIGNGIPSPWHARLLRVFMPRFVSDLCWEIDPQVPNGAKLHTVQTNGAGGVFELASFANFLFSGNVVKL